MPPALAIDVYGPITENDWFGGGITSKSIADVLNANPSATDITLNIHSPGGDVFEGNAIYNLLAAHPARITAVVHGLAASIASVICMAADEIIMAENAFMMIHDPWGITIGGPQDHLERAAMLEKVRGTIAATYAARTGMDAEKCLELMAAETWMTAAEAFENGFATSVTPAKAAPPPPSASARMVFNYAHAPEAVTAFLAHTPPPAPTAPVHVYNAVPPTAPGGSMKTVFAKIGLKDDASEAAALERVTALADLERDVLAITGATNLEQARGVMAAHKAASAELVTAKANLEKLESDRRTERLAAMIAQAKAEKKLTPALEAWAVTQTPEALTAFLAAAPTITQLASESHEDPDAGKGGALTVEGKRYEELRPIERANLADEQPAVYKALKTDWVQRGKPLNVTA